MSTVTDRETQRSFLAPNPILRKLSKVTDRSQTDTVTYSGVASKTSFFLAVTLIGIIAQVLVMRAFAGQEAAITFEYMEGFIVSMTKQEIIILVVALIVGFIAELLGIFVRKTVPVTGTIYAACQGYVISFLVFKALTGYEYLGLEALLLTVAVIAVMSWLYSSGIIKADAKFRAVLLSLVIGSIGVGVLTFVGSLIPATRPYVQSIFGNPVVAIGMDVVGIVLASLFLISDFSMIDTCVKEGYPKEYEWFVAFGLVFTVIWLYMKILDLIVKIAGKNKE